MTFSPRVAKKSGNKVSASLRSRAASPHPHEPNLAPPSSAPASPSLSWSFAGIALYPAPIPTARPVERLLGSSGEPLGAGNVRIHTGEAAAASAESMHARAYTYGQDIVFNRGEFNPSTSTGKDLLAHELAHTVRQSSPARYQLAFQKETGAAKKFYQEVEDALAKATDQAMKDYLTNLLALSKAVEAQSTADVKLLVPKVVQAKINDEPISDFDEFDNELLTRTFLMGLESEANRLRAFLRTLATGKRTRSDPNAARHYPDAALFRQLTERTIGAAKFGNGAEAAATVDALLMAFKFIVNEAASLSFQDVQHDLKSGYSPHSDYNKIGDYFQSLMSSLSLLTPPIFHGLQVMMESAIGDLEADKGTASLKAVRAALDTRIVPAYSTKIGDSNVLAMLERLEFPLQATRSSFNPSGRKHFDFFDTSKAGDKRAIAINFFDKDKTSGDEMQMSITQIIGAYRQQVAFLETFYSAANRSAMGTSALKLESVDDWRQFLHQKALEERKKGKKDAEILSTIIKFVLDYLQAFTVHTPFDIEDIVKKDDENYNKRQYPRAITGQLLQDCGVYALRTVFMLSLVKFDFNPELQFRFVFLPAHVELVITGAGLTLIASNNTITTFDATRLAEIRKAWEKNSTGSQPLTDDQFIGELAASLFSPRVDVPFRLVDAPKILKDDPKEKEMLQDFYTANAKQDVLAPVSSARLDQFHLKYIALNKKSRENYNTVIVPAWNVALNQVWAKHKAKLSAEIALAAKGKPNNYDAESKAYLTDLDAAWQKVTDAEAGLDKSRQEISDALAANPGLTASTASRGFGTRLSWIPPWQQALDKHKAAVQNQKDLKDPKKEASITPPFTKESLPPNLEQ